MAAASAASAWGARTVGVQGWQRAPLFRARREQGSLWPRQRAASCRPPAPQTQDASAVPRCDSSPPLLFRSCCPPSPSDTADGFHSVIHSAVPPSPVLGQGHLSVATDCRWASCWTRCSLEAGLCPSGSPPANAQTLLIHSRPATRVFR